MGLRRHKDVANLPKPFRYGYQPEPKGWALHLAWESSDEKFGLTVAEAEGRAVQEQKPGIKPCNRETIKSEEDTTFGMVKLRCEASGHETIVHKFVVLEQSEWLRDRMDPSDSIDEVPIRIPSHIRWWQVAWALEYMYEGRVPGFHLLAGEEWPQKYPGRQMRSIAWGLIELWEAGHFFGLDGLKERAEGAFAEYFLLGFKDALRRPHEAWALGWTGGRVGFEFRQAAWRIFGNLDVIPKDYFGTYMTVYGRGVTGQFAQDVDAIRGWESDMFDKTGASSVEDAGLLTEHLSDGPMPQYRDTFGSQMVELCMSIAWSGLFELGWFQCFMSHSTCPVRFRAALEKEMEASPASWPKDEYPNAPNSFERVQTSSDDDEQQ